MNQPPVILEIPIPISCTEADYNLLGPAKLAHAWRLVNSPNKKNEKVSGK